jgi:hypothetical protein
MSTGNAGAAIGLANTNKSCPIGPYVRDTGITGKAGPGALNDYAGCNGDIYYDRNALGEAKAFLANANSGVAAGKTAQWVTNPLLIAAGTTKVTITTGNAAADNATGTHSIFFVVPTAGIPANSWFWAFQD